MITSANKMLKQLKEAKPHIEQVSNQYIVTITVNGENYWGKAYLHPEDADFKSELVGCTIAHMRAITQALVTYRDAAQMEYTTMNQMLTDIMQNQDPEEIDPTFKMRKKVYQSKKRWQDYQTAVRTSQETLKNYLKNQDKAITSIKKQREQKTEF